MLLHVFFSNKGTHFYFQCHIWYSEIYGQYSYLSGHRKLMNVYKMWNRFCYVHSYYMYWQLFSGICVLYKDSDKIFYIIFKRRPNIDIFMFRKRNQTAKYLLNLYINMIYIRCIRTYVIIYTILYMYSYFKIFVSFYIITKS